MRSSLRQVLFRSTAGLDLNFSGGVFSLNTTRSGAVAAIPGWSFSRTDTNGTATALDLAGNVIQFPSRTNSLFPSNNFGDARWSDFSAGTTTRTSGFSDPEGGTTAWRLQGNNANTWWGNAGNASPPSGGTWASKTVTFSMWVRADAAYTAVLILNFNGGTSYSLNISVTDTWQRFSFTQTFVAGDTNTLRGVINHKSGNNTYVFGAQIEETSTATAYIPTTTAAVTVVLPRITNRGILVEEARTNLLLNSATLSTQSVTTTAVAHTLSFYGTGTVTLTGTSTAGPLVGTGASNRVTLTFTPTAGTLTLTVTGSVTTAQLEAGAFATSPIITTGAAGTRGADAASIVLPSNVSSYTATYNNGTTATGAVTAGATFNLIAARPWLNGYLQRFRVT